MAPKITPPPAMPSACNPASTPPRQGELETKCRVPCRNATTCPKTKTQSTFLPSANMAFLRIENRDGTPKRSPRRDLPRQTNLPFRSTASTRQARKSRSAAPPRPHPRTPQNQLDQRLKFSAPGHTSRDTNREAKREALQEEPASTSRLRAPIRSHSRCQTPLEP